MEERNAREVRFAGGEYSSLENFLRSAFNGFKKLSPLGVVAGSLAAVTLGCNPFNSDSNATQTPIIIPPTPTVEPTATPPSTPEATATSTPPPTIVTGPSPAEQFF